jgi:DNA transformation protein
MAMPVSNDYLTYVLEQLSDVGPIGTRRMFGAVALYHEERTFAIIDDDALYMKTDDSNRPDYEARGARPFYPDPNDPEAIMSYYAVPADVLEDRDELTVWARKASAVAAAAAARKVSRRRKSAVSRGKTKARTTTKLKRRRR